MDVRSKTFLHLRSRERALLSNAKMEMERFSGKSGNQLSHAVSFGNAKMMA